VPALVVRFPDGSKEFRYPERPLEIGDAIWHENTRHHVIATDEDDEGRQVAVTVEPDPQGIADMLGSEEGALVLTLAD